MPIPHNITEEFFIETFEKAEDEISDYSEDSDEDFDFELLMASALFSNFTTEEINEFIRNLNATYTVIISY